jgi:tetratricopeptide (TPR) repeat protein
VADTITTQPARRLDQAITVGDAHEISERLLQRGTDLRTFRRFVRGDLSRIVQTALAKEPARRYASVQAFSDDLERFLADQPVAVSGDGLGYRARKFVRRNVAAVAVAALLTMGLLGTTAFALYSAHQERQQRDAALAEVRRSNAIREYVQLMFRSAAETNTERPTAQDVLKGGAGRLFTEFDTEPAAARPVAIMLAELYMELGDWEGAAPLLERVLASPGIATDPDTQAKAQHYLAQAAYNRGEMERAGDLLRGAQATWGRLPRRYAKELNESRISQAKLERNAGDGLRAIATLQAMIAERPGLIGAQDREYAVAQSTLSAFLLDTGAYEQADHHARAATATFERLGMGKTSQAIVAMNNLAASLTQRDLDSQAEAILRRLVQLHRELYGTSSVNLALMQANLADSLRKQGRTSEAIPLLEQARPMAVATSGERSAATLHVSLALADAYLDAGRIDAGKALLDTAFPIVLADLGVQHRLAGVGYRVRANLHASRGNRKAAAADYDAAQAVFVQLGPAGKPSLARLKQKRRKAGL